MPKVRHALAGGAGADSTWPTATPPSAPWPPQSLGALHSSDAVPALQKLAADAGASPVERDAARAAIRQIERWGLLVRTVETVFQGASLASILLLMALGLAIVFGLMGVINMAHGELMALGAYSTFVVQNVVPRALARALRRLLRGRAARVVPGGGGWSASSWSAASSAGSTAGRWRRSC